MGTTNWKELATDYREFLQWNNDDTTHFKTQTEAKEALREDLEFIIGTNGYGDLFEREREYMTLLGMKEEG